jgi:hypothetical protein
VAEIGGGATGTAGDIIKDFVQFEDVIDLSAIHSNTNSGDGSFVWIGTDVFSGTAGQLRYFKTAVNNQTQVEGDINGDKIADFQLHLAGQITMAVDDFVL